MKITVDAGALCAAKNHRFGNYVVTENLMKALLLYDKKNDYVFYTFCQRPKTKNLQPKIFWSKLRVSLAEINQKPAYYFALNQSLPLMTPAKIISFSHGLAFHFFPHLYPDSAKKMKNQLAEMVKYSHKIIVPSIRIKNDLVSIYQSIDTKVIVIPYGVPLDMLDNLKLKIKNLKFRDQFFLSVSMDHPIKNQKILPKNKYKFVFANNVSRKNLKSLYQKASALVTTSLYESFNLPVLEALSLGCPVIGLKSAIIPEFVPYVNICQNEKELLLLLEKAKKKKLEVPLVSEIRRKFSWKNYVTNICEIVAK